MQQCCFSSRMRWPSVTHQSQFPVCRQCNSESWAVKIPQFASKICFFQNWDNLLRWKYTEDTAVVRKKNNSGSVYRPWSSRMTSDRCCLLIQIPETKGQKYYKGSRICKQTASSIRREIYPITYFLHFFSLSKTLSVLTVDPVAATILSTLQPLKEHPTNSLFQCQQLTEFWHYLCTWSTTKKSNCE